MGMIFCLVYLGVIVYILYSRSNASSGSGNKSEIDFADVSEHIDRLNDLRDQLQVIEELINDVTVCSPGKHHKSVSFEWISNSGKEKRYSILIDGESQNTSDILKFAYSERDRLRCLLHTETEKLSEQCVEKPIRG